MSDIPDQPEAQPESPPEALDEPRAEAGGPADQPDEDARAADAAESEPRPDPVFSVGDEAIDQEETDRSARVLSGIPAAVTMGEVRSRGPLAAGAGAIAAGSIHVTTIDPRREKYSSSAAFTGESLRRLADMYAVAPSDPDLDDALAVQSAVYLGGETGSGRHSAAWLALARRHGDDRVVGVTVAPGRTLVQAMDADTFRDGHGHVVDANTGAVPDLMDLATLQERAAKAQATVVVVGPPLRRGSDLGFYAVRHRRAEPVEMLRRQLLFRIGFHDKCLGDCSHCAGACVAPWVEQCLSDPDLTAHLGATMAAHEIEGVAVAIAEKAAVDLDLSQLLAGLLPDQLRLQAGDIVRAPDDEARDDGRRPGGTAAYRRAFRIAYAVFDGAPMASVFSAANRLSVPARPDASTPGADAGAPVREALDVEVDLLLPDGMRAATDDPMSPGSPRVAAMANEQLVPAILDVAWNDFGMGERLLTWLDVLTSDPQPLVRDRAAMVAGRLGSYDFESVFDSLVQRWASGRSQRLHRSAGLSLLQSAYDTRLHQQVRRRMQQWVFEGSINTRDSVAWAYAFGIGQLLPYAGIHHLRVVAHDASQRRNLLVAIGVERTYAPSRAAEIVGELVDWGRSGVERVQRHAAQSFLRLARRSGEAAEGLWPELLSRLRDDDLDVRQIAELWVLALSYPGSAAQAWRILTYWLMWGDRREVVADQVLATIRGIAVVPEIKVRIRHQLRHVWREQRPSSPLLDAVAAMIGEV